MLYSKQKRKKSFVPINCSQWLCAAAISALLVSCGGGSGDTGPETGNNTGPTGGIIGTGVRLEGTASSQTKFASNDIEVKSKSGEKSLAPIGNRGRFALDKLNGEGPFLLRASTGNNQFLYGIGYPQADGKLAQNIHSYSDAAARNWFASNGLDIDSAFMGDTPIAQLPQQTTLRTISNNLQSIVSAALAEYDLPATDLNAVDYDADDTGVDLFLDNNPVVINNGTINILILDRATQVLTPSTSNVMLDTDLALDDVQPPSTPEAVRALASQPGEVVVVWNASTDNIGVTAYQVFRDGALIATTPFPVYTDTGLMANTPYSYTVVAVDSSGIKSADSIAAMSTPQAGPDNLAPPTPLLVMLEPSIGNIRVSWSQTEIFDVKAFNVYRTGAAEAAFKVTSDFVNDVNVSAGSEYCYEISAEDASGNESARTAEQCATTSGTPDVVPPQPDVVTPGPVVTPGVLLAPTLDVTGLACSQELADGGQFKTDTVLSAGCYLAPRGLRVFEPANLTAEPGVVIKFAASRELRIDSGASLTANGTAAAPIVFSASDPTPGFWNGVKFFNSNSSRNQLDFVQIEYAGGGTNGQNLETISSFGSAARLSVKNTTVRNSSGTGIEFQNGTIIGAFEGNLLVGNNTPLLITADAANALGSDSRYSGNAIDQVRLTRTDITTATSLAKLDVPYVSGRLIIKNSLTVAPGVEWRFESDGELVVDEDATLKAVGTPEQPILFTATDPTPGFWDGIQIRYSTGANELAYLTVEYGGSGTTGANLTVKSFDSNNSRLSANNVTLRHALNDGFAIESGAALPKFDQITSTQNGRTGRVAVNVAGKIGAGASFMGNDVDVISITNSAVNDDATWLAHDVPYAADDINIKAGLTLSPGTTLIMNAGAKISVSDPGYLSAVGTAFDNIVFTGKEQFAGYWDGIEFRYTPSIANRLSHVVVEYGGAGIADTTKTGNVSAKCFASIPSRLSIDNAMLNFGLGWGLYGDPEGCQITLGDNVTYTSNTVGGFNLMP